MSRKIVLRDMPGYDVPGTPRPETGPGNPAATVHAVSWNVNSFLPRTTHMLGILSANSVRLH